MPDISLPEVHLPDFKLPEGLRDVNREDIQKAMPDVKFPKIDLKRSDISKELAKATKEIEKAGRELEKALPRKSAPSPLPFVIFGMLAGLFVGWFLASSTVTGPRIGGLVDEARARVARWRTSDATDEDDYDSNTATFPDALHSSRTDTMTGNGSGVGVGPGGLSEGVGAAGVSSERF